MAGGKGSKPVTWAERHGILPTLVYKSQTRCAEARWLGPESNSGEDLLPPVSMKGTAQSQVTEAVSTVQAVMTRCQAEWNATLTGVRCCTEAKV